MSVTIPENLDKDLIDQSVTMKVRVALRENEKTRDICRSLKVGTYKRCVYIQGQVDSPELKDAITDVAIRADGVNKVVNLVEVKG
ncbi:MAG: BON domain-containing protein [Firmicutes bacterium]|nr:BON domain-containing protein [Candidatus Fermentithermobacillaceae bacterium]